MCDLYVVRELLGGVVSTWPRPPQKVVTSPMVPIFCFAAFAAVCRTATTSELHSCTRPLSTRARIQTASQTRAPFKRNRYKTNYFSGENERRRRHCLWQVKPFAPRARTFIRRCWAGCKHQNHVSHSRGTVGTARLIMVLMPWSGRADSH